MYLVQAESVLGDVMFCTLSLSEIRKKYPQAVESLESGDSWNGSYRDKRGIKVDVNINKK